VNSPLLILGMHRSGTSCLAGCLEAGGLSLGAVNAAAPHNKKGNRELEDVRALHDRILSFHGYSWDYPPPSGLEWRPIDVEALKDKTAALAEQKAWGFKDPRTLFCMQGWETVFKPRYVATFRHPLSVMASLMGRAKAWNETMTSAHACDLWIAYNRQLLDLTAGTETKFVKFGGDEGIYLARIAELATHFGLDAKKAVGFYSSQLTNETPDTERVPDGCEAIWDELNARVK